MLRRMEWSCDSGAGRSVGADLSVLRPGQPRRRLVLHGLRGKAGADRGRPRARKTVTALFCDLVGSTSLGERHDPEVLRPLLERYFAEAREAVERHGGRVEKFIGDAVCAVFGLPAAHEDDALRAVRAGLEVQERLARLRDGVADPARGARSGSPPARSGRGRRRAADRRHDEHRVPAPVRRGAGPGARRRADVAARAGRGRCRARAAARREGQGRARPGLAGPRARPRLAGPRPAARRSDGGAGPRVGGARGRVPRGSSRTGSCRLFTVLGVAGAGKSRLVEEFLGGWATRRRSCAAGASRTARASPGSRWPRPSDRRSASPSSRARTRSSRPSATPPRARAATQRLSPPAWGACSASPGRAAPSRRRGPCAASSSPAARRGRSSWSSTTCTGPSPPCSTSSSSSPSARTPGSSCCAWRARSCWTPGPAGGRRAGGRHRAAGGAPSGGRGRPGGRAPRRRAPAGRGPRADHIGRRRQPAVHRGGRPDARRRGPARPRRRGLGRGRRPRAIRIPPTVSALLSSRLDRLPEPERGAAGGGVDRGAVLLRRRARGAPARCVARRAPGTAPLARAQGARRPRATPGPGRDGYRFRHILIRDAAYDAIPEVVPRAAPPGLRRLARGGGGGRHRGAPRGPRPPPRPGAPVPGGARPAGRPGAPHARRAGARRGGLPCLRRAGRRADGRAAPRGGRRPRAAYRGGGPVGRAALEHRLRGPPAAPGRPAPGRQPRGLRRRRRRRRRRP